MIQPLIFPSAILSPRFVSLITSSKFVKLWSTVGCITLKTSSLSVLHNNTRLSPTFATYKRLFLSIAIDAPVPHDNSSSSSFNFSI